MAEATLKVRTHVGRDLLQSAQLFNSDKKVVWEYVANGLQYRHEGVTPIVYVQVRSAAREIVIKDNGRGMDRSDLGNFFVMHGENQDRRAGKPGRGRFGTGKSRAFGIGGRLRVSSVRSGKRNTVELTLKAIESSGPAEIPLKPIEVDVLTKDPSGTVISISKIKLKRFDVPGIIQYIELQIARMPNCGKVYVDDHECEFSEPAIQEEYSISPPQEWAKVLGPGPLKLKVSKSPLPPDGRGVAVHAHGVWLTTTLAGAENQHMSEWIFGEIDVPALDDDDAPIPAFDMSRSLQLNPNNDVVAILIPFLGREIDQLRRKLVQAEKARRQREDARKLANEAQRIAELINTDFQAFNERLSRVRAQSGIGRDQGPATTLGGKDDTCLVLGTEQSGELDPPTKTVVEMNGGDGGDDSDTDTDGTPTQRATELAPDDNGCHLGNPAGGNGRKPHSQGGFDVQFRELGAEEHRAKYIPRTIFINLEHPQIAAALGGGGTNDPIFRRLAYEVAFSEYSIALAQEKNLLGEYGDDPSDAIWEIRNTLNRMARRDAELYKS